MASPCYSYFHFSTKEHVVGLSKVNRNACALATAKEQRVQERKEKIFKNFSP